MGGVIENTLLGGRYHLRTLIASGPHADVWRALDSRLDRMVVVKIQSIDDASDPELSSSFAAAAQAAAGLYHPNVVAVYDTGLHQGIPYVVMENMEGGSLADRDRKPISPGRAALVAEAAWAALAHAHSHEVTHGNIKPSNVLFNGRGHPKLTDFGAGASSEQPKADDVAAVGAIFYQLLTGRAPSRGSGGKIPGPRDFRSDIPRGLDLLVLQGLGEGAPSLHLDAAAMREAIAPFVLAEETAPGSSSQNAPSAQSFVRSEARWLVRLALVIALVAGVTLVALNLSGRGPLPGLFRESPSQPVEIAEVSIFDPVAGGGDGAENREEAPLAFDEDTETNWETQWYRTPNLGGAKPGVGLVFDLGSEVELFEIEVVSVAPAWSGSIRHSDDGSTWSEPTPTISVEQDQRFEVSGKHRFWMIWISRLVQTPGQGSADLPYSVGIVEVNAFSN